MHFSRWTLRSRLIGLTVVLVAVTSIVIGGVMAFVVRESITSQVDGALRARAQFIAGNNFTNGPGGGNPLYLEPGTIIAAFAANDRAGEYCAEGGTNCSTDLGDSELASLENVQSNGVQEVQIPKYGEYRATAIPAATSAGRTTFVVAVPQAALNRQIAPVIGAIGAVVLLAIVLAGLLGALIIGRALRPLRRVAGVASNVASLPLERGDVEVPQRVPEGDTNPHTEVGQVGSALNNLLDTVSNALVARQASEDKLRNFVADASHELRTPLASIRGYAELTRRFGGELTEGVQHNIGRIESEAQRMTSLVEDLLLLARLDAERELDTSEVDLSRLLVDVVSDAHAAGRDHEWDLDLPEEPVIVRGDPAKLQQVFTNLLANARVHTPAGTRVTVELSEPRDGHVLARVKDDGPGIPEQLRPQLFGRFVRGDSSRARTTGSTGLGLSIVSAVVQAHHGTVSVASEPGLTVFTVQLPVEQPAAVPQPA